MEREETTKQPSLFGELQSARITKIHTNQGDVYLLCVSFGNNYSFSFVVEDTDGLSWT